MKYVVMVNRWDGRQCIGVYNDYYTALGKMIMYFYRFPHDNDNEIKKTKSNKHMEVHTLEIHGNRLDVEIYKWEENEDERLD